MMKLTGMTDINYPATFKSDQSYYRGLNKKVVTISWLRSMILFLIHGYINFDFFSTFLYYTFFVFMSLTKDSFPDGQSLNDRRRGALKLCRAYIHRIIHQ